MSRRLPLPARFPGKVVARARIWFGPSSYTAGFEGPIPLELAQLFVTVVSHQPGAETLARLASLADEIGDAGKRKLKAVPLSLTDKAVRKRVSRARTRGRLGAR